MPRPWPAGIVSKPEPQAAVHIKHIHWDMLCAVDQMAATGVTPFMNAHVRCAELYKVEPMAGTVLQKALDCVRSALCTCDVRCCEETAAAAVCGAFSSCRLSVRDCALQLPACI